MGRRGEAAVFSGMRCLCCTRCLSGKLSASSLNINSCQVMNSPSLFYNGTKIGNCLAFLCNYPMRPREHEGGWVGLATLQPFAVPGECSGAGLFLGGRQCCRVHGCNVLPYLALPPVQKGRFGRWVCGFEASLCL